MRDRLVVRIRDEQLSVKLQLDETLTLENAVDQAGQKEAVRKQQRVVRSSPQDGATGVDAVQARPKSSSVDKSKSVFQQTRPKWYRSTSHHAQKTSRRCGKEPNSKQRCPARDVKCHKCAKRDILHQFVCPANKSEQCAITAVVLIAHL